jgi:hypothetical protein
MLRVFFCFHESGHLSLMEVSLASLRVKAMAQPLSISEPMNQIAILIGECFPAMDVITAPTHACMRHPKPSLDESFIDYGVDERFTPKRSLPLHSFHFPMKHLWIPMLRQF